MRNDLFSDSYCVITELPNVNGMYADFYLNYYEMPIQWAKKIVTYFEAGNYSYGYRLLDMIERVYKLRRAKA